MFCWCPRNEAAFLSLDPYCTSFYSLTWQTLFKAKDNCDKFCFYFLQVVKATTTNLTAVVAVAAAAVNNTQARASHPDLEEVGTSFEPGPTQLLIRPLVQQDLRRLVQVLDLAQSVTTGHLQQQRQQQLHLQGHLHPPFSRIRLQSWEDLFLVS